MIFICIINFSSCKSAPFFVFGEKAAAIQDIYTEYYNIAQEYFAQENYEKAAVYYKKSLSSKKLNVASYYQLGVIAEKKGNWNEAQNIYSNIIKRDSENSALKQRLAYVKSRAGDLDGAELLYKEVLDENPNNDDALCNYIVVLYANKKTEDAKNQFDILVKTFPDNARINSIKSLLEKSEAKTESASSTVKTKS